MIDWKRREVICIITPDYKNYLESQITEGGFLHVYIAMPKVKKCTLV